jgi:predicted DCC family thiol-disulfide oxidoreductase YuxK
MDSFRHLILYDGVCGLCNRLNTFVLLRDRERVFQFASLQSVAARSVLQDFGRRRKVWIHFYVVTNYRGGAPKLLDRSQAAIFVLKQLGGLWRWAGLVNILPVRLLNLVYNVVARNRYRILGRYDNCLLPNPERRSFY